VQKAHPSIISIQGTALPIALYALKRFTTILILLLLPSTIMFGQGHFISIAVDLAVPNTSLKYLASTGFGGSFRYEHALTNHIAGIGTINYLSFTKKNYPSPAPSTSTLSFKNNFIPIEVGAKFYLFSNSKLQNGLYVSAELGLTVLILKVSINNSSEVSSESDFSYAPGLGYQTTNLEFGYRQQFITSSGRSVNYSNFRIAYLFKRR
jgi:hypothetical protein